MNAFATHVGVAAWIPEDNVDTDQIIPSREMKRVSKKGLGEGLFAGWRYRYDGKEKIGLNEDFILNQPPWKSASIILAGKNFGCGSSREHAVWALRDFGIRVVVAESFGRIFKNNCVRNGLLAIAMSGPDIRAIVDATTCDPQRLNATVDLEAQTLSAPGIEPISFEIEASDREMLRNGLDYVDVGLEHLSEVDAFKQRDRAARPWAYL